MLKEGEEVGVPRWGGSATLPRINATAEVAVKGG